ncbi:MAG TPA: lytic transglycosylase domain-containing protein [Hyphomonadaceae bacterium]|nr:lytic transglycosylase domain-containing protein [Hyphomonadaceae bacterium]
MVRALALLLAANVAASPAFAQSADWRGSGGGLFAGLVEEAHAPARAEARPSEQPFDAIVRRVASDHNLDPNLLHAILIVESAYRPDAVSAAGAQGLAQLMPGTARDLGVDDPFDPEQNVAGGGAYIASMLERYRDVRLALAAYNAGPGRVDRLGRVPAVPETEGYVRDVVECFLDLTAGRNVRSVGECREDTPPAARAEHSPILIARTP